MRCCNILCARNVTVLCSSLCCGSKCSVGACVGGWVGAGAGMSVCVHVRACACAWHDVMLQYRKSHSLCSAEHIAAKCVCTRLCFTWRNAAQNVCAHACIYMAQCCLKCVCTRLCFTWRNAAQNVYVHACALHSDADQIVEVTFVLSMAQCCLKC